MQVRDHALGLKDDVPKSDVNKEFYTQNVEKEVCKTTLMMLIIKCLNGVLRAV